VDINIETVQGNTSVTILHPHGRIDGSNYQVLIDQGNRLYQAGTRHLVIDLADVSFLSSAGLVALHKLVLIMSGQKVEEQQDGWHALGAIEHDAEAGPQGFVKLLNPQPKVTNTLQMAGMDAFFETFTDTAAAVASFS